MACILTQGFALDCRDSVGGVKRVLITEHANINTLTETAGIVTTFTLNLGKQFFDYKLERNVGSMTDTQAGSVENGTNIYTTEVVVVLNKLQSTVRNEWKLLAQNRLAIIVEDKNGKYWLCGKSTGMDLTSSNGATGTAGGDRSGYTFTFTGEEPEPCVEVNSGLIATLLAPAV